MQSSKLHEFIAHARQKGMDHSTIRMLLLSAGWKEKEVAQALTEQGLEMAVPLPIDRGGAREAFFHLLAFAGLYTTLIAAVVLFFRYINRMFPDPAFPSRGTYEVGEMEAVRWWLAALIVAFPVFLGLSRFLLREIAREPEKASSGIRRWLTFMTLFFAALALGGDVITLIYYLLEGELSIRFLLKVATVLAVAGLSFAYYFLSLRMAPEDARASRMHRTFGWLASLFALTALVWGSLVIGSPSAERLRKLDDVRIDDLRSIEREIRAICLGQQRYSDQRHLNRPLPGRLEEVAQEAKEQRPRIQDPETGELYNYEVLEGSRYRLCATFRGTRDEEKSVFWNHPAGRHCFELDALDPTQ